MEIVPLTDERLDEAAALVGARYRALRRDVPELPPRYQDVEVLRPMLAEIIAQAPAVAACRGPRLAGFLAAWKLPHFRGRRGVFSPEWANAAELDDSRRIYDALYAALAPRWLANGCVVHAVSLLAHDRAAIEGWHWLGFGMAAADAVRDLRPVTDPIPPVDIRRATPEDAGQVAALAEALRRHLAAAPTFLPYVERQARAEIEQTLADPSFALLLASAGDEPIAFLKIGPASDDAGTIIRDPGTASITGAYTRPEQRGAGVAAALLDRGLQWARASGYTRCAVDFEPMNVPAARFWTHHFRLVTVSVQRALDERIVWAHDRRADADLW